MGRAGNAAAEREKSIKKSKSSIEALKNLIGKQPSPIGKMKFPIGKSCSPIGKIILLIGKISLPIGKVRLPIGKMKFPIGKLCLPIGKIRLPIGKVKFPIGKLCVPVEEDKGLSIEALMLVLSALCRGGIHFFLNKKVAKSQEQNDASSAQAILPARRSVQPPAQPDFTLFLIAKDTADAGFQHVSLYYMAAGSAAAIKNISSKSLFKNQKFIYLYPLVSFMIWNLCLKPYFFTQSPQRTFESSTTQRTQRKSRFALSAQNLCVLYVKINTVSKQEQKDASCTQAILPARRSAQPPVQPAFTLLLIAEDILKLLNVYWG